jgi:hypothetical protein
MRWGIRYEAYGGGGEKFMRVLRDRAIA